MEYEFLHNNTLNELIDYVVKNVDFDFSKMLSTSNKKVEKGLGEQWV